MAALDGDFHAQVSNLRTSIKIAYFEINYWHGNSFSLQFEFFHQTQRQHSKGDILLMHDYFSYFLFYELFMVDLPC